jgi:hypothetical protein
MGFDKVVSIEKLTNFTKNSTRSTKGNMSEKTAKNKILQLFNLGGILYDS